MLLLACADKMCSHGQWNRQSQSPPNTVHVTV
jgi:hypothetical protein